MHAFVASILLVLAHAFVLVPASSAQVPGHTPGPWRQVETEHFLFVYPDELSEWALDMASRIEAVHEAVADLVGFAPEDRVTVVVDDPGNVSNGMMMPGPTLYMWPTPPSPRSMIGENRGWGEILAVHEFAHAAHLTRPSRNPFRRFITSVLIPLPVTTIMRSAPRWSTEGYATYVEGRLTGSGRPHGVWRPAVLRTWALEGELPTYGQVSGSSGYYGGAMAYLMGSAYLEWLVDREGGDEATLPNLWRRMTARQKRSFDNAFTGVFGAPPAELYGRFTVDVTERALAVRDAVEEAGGVVDGELFQRLSWHVGDPAVSPDGRRLALQLTPRDGPSRLVVMSTTPDTLSKEARERYEEVFEEDPEDVEPVRRRPRPQESQATLNPVLGQAYSAPAWMPDGDGILVIRSDMERNERMRPDLFLWRWEDGDVRRVTRGAAIREAAPAPDGTWAAGLRCLHAICDLVRIELDDGEVTALTDTDPLRPYYHPRISPDGRTIVASVQVDGEWRLVAMDADGTGERRLGPDDGAARYDAEFLGDGRLILTSTRGGIHDIEILDPRSGEATPVTRVIGSAVAPTAAVAPDTTAAEAVPDSAGGTPAGAEAEADADADTDTPADSAGEAPGTADIFFLSLHSRGWDLRRIERGASPAVPVVETDAAHFPAATIPIAVRDSFPAVPLGEIRPYGLGPRFRILLPVMHFGEDGYGGGLGLGGADPIGRLTWQLQGAYGTDRSPVGGALRLRYRGFQPWIHAEGFWARDPFHAPTTFGNSFVPGDPPRPAVDEGFYGGFGALELRGRSLALGQSLRAGGSAGRFETVDASRVLAFGEYDVSLRTGTGHRRMGGSLATHAAIGRTGDLDWTRVRVSAAVDLRGEDNGLRLSGTFGATDAPAGSIEAFSVGGSAPLLHDPAIASQRVTMPALAASHLRGGQVRTAMAELFSGLALSTFYWVGDVEGDGRDWYRLWGTRIDEETPPVPIARIPGTRLQAGLARLLDDPGKGEWRGWLMVTLLP